MAKRKNGNGKLKDGEAVTEDEVLKAVPTGEGNSLTLGGITKNVNLQRAASNTEGEPKNADHSNVAAVLDALEKTGRVVKTTDGRFYVPEESTNAADNNGTKTPDDEVAPASTGADSLPGSDGIVITQTDVSSEESQEIDGSEEGVVVDVPEATPGQTIAIADEGGDLISEDDGGAEPLGDASNQATDDCTQVDEELVPEPLGSGGDATSLAHNEPVEAPIITRHIKTEEVVTRTQADASQETVRHRNRVTVDRSSEEGGSHTQPDRRPAVSPVGASRDQQAHVPDRAPQRRSYLKIAGIVVATVAVALIGFFARSWFQGTSSGDGQPTSSAQVQYVPVVPPAEEDSILANLRRLGEERAATKKAIREESERENSNDP